jgi:hypothetical protein
LESVKHYLPQHSPRFAGTTVRTIYQRIRSGERELALTNTDWANTASSISLATLREFADAPNVTIKDMDNDPDLRLTFLGLTGQSPDAWAAAVRFFKANRALLKGIRNDIGALRKPSRFECRLDASTRRFRQYCACGRRPEAEAALCGGDCGIRRFFEGLPNGGYRHAI